MVAQTGSVNLKSKSIFSPIPPPEVSWSGHSGEGPGSAIARAAITGGGGVQLRSIDQRTPISNRINALYAAGFRFATNHDGAGTIVALIGVRACHGVIDVVQLYGEHDADAIRIPGDEPDVLFPRKVLWRTTGSSCEVIDMLLDLPEPLAGGSTAISAEEMSADA
jgi:hypothetical protein